MRPPRPRQSAIEAALSSAIRGLRYELPEQLRCASLEGMAEHFLELKVGDVVNVVTVDLYTFEPSLRPPEAYELVRKKRTKEAFKLTLNAVETDETLVVTVKYDKHGTASVVRAYKDSQTDTDCVERTLVLPGDTDVDSVNAEISVRYRFALETERELRLLRRFLKRAEIRKTMGASSRDARSVLNALYFARARSAD